MKSTVAIVATRPETVLEDYRRVMTVAGLLPVAGLDPSTASSPAASVPLLVAAGGRGTWPSGTLTPPWQLAGILAALDQEGNEAHSVEVHPVAAPGTGSGPSAVSGDLWKDLLHRYGARLTDKNAWQPSPARPAGALPALEAALADGFRLPRPLRGRRTILLPVPAAVPGWPVAGGVALLQSLVAGRLGRPSQVPRSEVRAEVVDYAREMLGEIAAVMDGVYWHVQEGGGSRAVQRNVLLASNDPVAVDSVTARLSGLDPLSVPWLRLCRDRGLGAVAPEDLRIVGQAELLDLDFLGAGDTFAPGSGLYARNPWNRFWWRLTRRRSLERRLAASPWGRWQQDFCTIRSAGMSS